MEGLSGRGRALGARSWDWELRMKNREIPDGDERADNEQQPSHRQPVHRTHPTRELQPLDLQALPQSLWAARAAAHRPETARQCS